MAQPISRSVFGHPCQRSPADTLHRQFAPMEPGGADPTTRSDIFAEAMKTLPATWTPSRLVADDLLRRATHQQQSTSERL
jgi:hypothetical protein